MVFGVSLVWNYLLFDCYANTFNLQISAVEAACLAHN